MVSGLPGGTREFALRTQRYTEQKISPWYKATCQVSSGFIAGMVSLGRPLVMVLNPARRWPHGELWQVGPVVE